MRTKIKVDGKFYRPVPWFTDGYGSTDDSCKGCVFTNNGCINATYGNVCDSDGEFSGMILIPATKQGMADYVAKKLGATDVVE